MSIIPLERADPILIPVRPIYPSLHLDQISRTNDSYQVMTPVSDRSEQTPISVRSSRKSTPTRSPTALEHSPLGKSEESGFIFSLGIGQRYGHVIRSVNWLPMQYRIPCKRKPLSNNAAKILGRKRNSLAALDASIKEKSLPPRRARNAKEANQRSPDMVSLRTTSPVRTASARTAALAGSLKANLEIPSIAQLELECTAPETSSSDLMDSFPTSL